MKKSLPLPEVYRLLEPGPVVLLSTHHKRKDNVMTMSWHTMLDFEPPLLACVVSNRDFSYSLLTATKECVINVPGAELIEAVVGCGNVSGKKFDKFRAFGLTKSIASRVKAPLIEECHANLECKVVDTRMVAKYGMFILEVVQAWHDPRRKSPKTLHHRGKGVFMVAGRSIRTRSRMK